MSAVRERLSATCFSQRSRSAGVLASTCVSAERVSAQNFYHFVRFCAGACVTVKDHRAYRFATGIDQDQVLHLPG